MPDLTKHDAPCGWKSCARCSGWRVLRGVVVIREDKRAAYMQYRHIVVPDEKDEDRTSHVGVVLAMGPPARTKRDVEVPYGFSVGDRVVFHFGHLEKAWTREWIDGEIAVWVPQQFVDGVVDGS